MQLGKKIKALRESKGLTQTDLAEKVGLRPSQISSLENEKIPPFQDYTKYLTLATVFQIDPQELWEIGQQDRKEWKAKEHLKKAETLEPGISKANSRPIPILSDIPAGHPKDYTNGDYPPGVADDYYEFKVDDPNAFFLRAEGDCMSPYIIDGDLLLIYPNDKVENGDVAIVANGKDRKEVRRVNIQPDQVILICDNPAYPAIVWRNDRDKPKIIGRVKEIIRRR